MFKYVFSPENILFFFIKHSSVWANMMKKHIQYEAVCLHHWEGLWLWLNERENTNTT